MASGYFDVYVRSNREKFRVSWTDTPINGTNSSKVSVSVAYYSPWTTYSSAWKTMQLWVNGTKYTREVKGLGGKGWSSTLISATQTIAHNSDGKKSINIRFNGEVNIKYSGRRYYYVDSGNHTATLTTLTVLPSTFSMANTTVTLGNNHSLTIYPKNSSVRHTIVGKIGGYTWTIADKTATTNVRFTVPTAAQAYMSSKTATCTITVTSYYGSKNLGSKAASFTAAIPSSAVPSLSASGLSITVDPSSEVTGAFVQGKGYAKVAISGVTYPAGAKAKQYVITLNGKKYTTTSATYTIPDVLKKAGENTVTAYVIDSRGCVSSTVTKTFNVHAYSLPIIKSVTADRSNGTQLDPSGNKVMLTAAWSYSDCGGLNKTSIKIYSKESMSAGEYGEPIKTADNVESFSEVLPNTYDLNTSYDLKVLISDSFGSSSEYETEIETIEALIDIAPYGVAIGKVFEGTEKQVQIEYPTYFDNEVYIDGSAITSDERLKANIKEISPILKEIWASLTVCMFNYKKAPEKLNLGVIAQEVIKVFEKYGLNWEDYSFVIESGDRYYINYEFIHMLTFVMAQEHENRIAELEKKIEKLAG